MESGTAKIVQNNIELTLKERFAPFEEKAKEWEAKAKALVVTDITQTDKMQQAREARLALRRIRLDVTKLHEQEKADALAKGRMLDTIKRTLLGYIEPLEAHLQEQEDFADVQTAKRKQALYDERIAAIAPYRMPMDGLQNIPFGEMNDDAFETLLFGLKAGQEARENQKKEAERQRLEAEQRAKDERERIRQENEKAKLIQARTQRLMGLGFTWDEPSKTYVFPLDDGPITVWGELGEWSEKDFSESLNNATKIIHAFRTKKKLEADELAAKLKTETEAREKLEAEKREREEKEEAERKRIAAEQRKLKRGPDKQKLLNFAERIELLEPITLKDDAAKEIYNDVVQRLKFISLDLRTAAENLWVWTL